MGGTIFEYLKVIYLQDNTDGHAVDGVGLRPLDRGFESRCYMFVFIVYYVGLLRLADQYFREVLPGVCKIVCDVEISTTRCDCYTTKNISETA